VSSAKIMISAKFTGVEFSLEADVEAMALPRELVVVTSETVRVRPKQHEHLSAV